jgi:hypothetical protein
MTLRLPGLTPAKVRDLSAHGVCCTTERALPAMTQVHLVLLLPTPQGPREVACSGAIVRCVRLESAKAGEADWETAIFFTDLRETDRAAIADAVSAWRSQGAVA